MLRVKANELGIEFEGSCAKNSGIIQLRENEIDISVDGQKDIADKISLEIIEFLQGNGIYAVRSYKPIRDMGNVYKISW